MAAATTATVVPIEEIESVEEELRALQKKRSDVEYRLRGLAAREKGRVLGMKGPRLQQVKRSREWREREEGTRENSSSNTEERLGGERNGREEWNKRQRLSSVVASGQKVEGGREGFRGRERQREEEDKPKVTSAIVSNNPVPVVGEKPRPSLDTNNSETRQRSKKMFGVLVGTLKSFKSDISKKTEAERRREELEQQVQAKVQEEEEQFKEEQKRKLQEEKEAELALREKIKTEQEEKETMLLNMKWNLQRAQLEKWLKTASKPHIYFRPVKLDGELLKHIEARTEELRRQAELNEVKPEEEDKIVSQTEEMKNSGDERVQEEAAGN